MLRVAESVAELLDRKSLPQVYQSGSTIRLAFLYSGCTAGNLNQLRMCVLYFSIEPCAGMAAERRDWYELYRIPPTIWAEVVAGLQEHGNVPRAWVQALSTSFPRRSLIDLQRQPKLSPFCLHNSGTIKTMQVCVGGSS
jgi:hypothetical protein